MQNEMWAWLLRQVPADQHNQLMIVTGSGTEIAVQALLRVEGDFVAIKGRLAGSQDAGRVYFIPYANVDYFGLQRDVKETEFDAMFGAGSLSASVPAAAATVAAPAAPPTPAPAAPLTAEVPVSTSVSNKTPLPLKSEVLERFRSRIATASPSIAGGSLRPPDA